MTENKKPVAGITAYQQLPQNDARALMQAVLVNPVTVSVDAGNWNYYSTGIFAGCDTQNPVINHAVVLNGFGKKPLDGYACKSNAPETITACGMCGILSDSAYPLGAFLGAPTDPALRRKAGLISQHVFQGGLPEGADGAAFIQLRREL